MRNREQQPLLLPEYGRNVQNMVAHCKTIEDKSKRQECAEAIIQTMSAFSKTEQEREDYWQILWDHLYIMSGFELEVDFPYEVTTKEEFTAPHPRVLNNNHQHKPFYRHYGRNVERMIEIVRAMPKGQERSELEKLVALQMKRHYVVWNKDSVANAKIFADLYELSHGEIYLDEGNCALPEAHQLMTTDKIVTAKKNGGKKKGKKNGNKKQN